MWLKDLQKWWNEWNLPIMFIFALIFFIIVILFYSRISKWLGNREEVQYFVPTWAKQYGTVFSDTKKKPWFGSGKYEGECRRIMESIFARPFAKARPNFLKRASTGRNLELDGYNPDLKLAYEYNGKQHLHFNPKYHGTIKVFEDQLERDRLKAELCAKAGIKLVIIPHTVKWDKLESYIRGELRRLGVL